jgi:hypothetical protein
LQPLSRIDTAKAGLPSKSEGKKKKKEAVIRVNRADNAKT